MRDRAQKADRAKEVGIQSNLEPVRCGVQLWFMDGMKPYRWEKMLASVYRNVVLVAEAGMSLI